MPAEPLQEVERRALGRQQRRRVPADLGHLGPALAALSVRADGRDLHGGIELAKRLRTRRRGRR